jgi:hypothetical protein
MFPFASREGLLIYSELAAAPSVVKAATPKRIPLVKTYITQKIANEVGGKA